MPFLFVAGPFAFLFGVVAVETGLDIPQSVGMSLVVIAGAAQFTAVQLLSEAAPIWVAMAAALAVNLRMAMYSASLQPHLGSAPLWQRVIVSYLNFDISYALGIAHFDERPERPVNQKSCLLSRNDRVDGTVLGDWDLDRRGSGRGAARKRLDRLCDADPVPGNRGADAQDACPSCSRRVVGDRSNAPVLAADGHRPLDRRRDCDGSGCGNREKARSVSHSATEIWAIIAVLGVGTFLIRFSFLGLVGGRRMPGWLLRHLRYTPVAVLPGLVAPLVAWPDAVGGNTDPVRLAAAIANAGRRLPGERTSFGAHWPVQRLLKFSTGCSESLPG